LNGQFLSTDPGRGRKAVERYLALSDEVSRAWVGEPSVLEDFRRVGAKASSS